MNIVIDAFGGDNAPLEVIRGAVDANRDFNIDITLVGDENTIKKCAKENALDISALKIKHADSVIDVCEEPTNVIKAKKIVQWRLVCRCLLTERVTLLFQQGQRVRWWLAQHLL